MEYQILLLPRSDYWKWVQACSDYVMRYGANMTQDPETAARYMAPAQVITFPLLKDGYPERGDIKRWFEVHHPGILLDPIEADDPQALAEELTRRIEDEDRYGQKRKSFYLLWPTEFPVITQAFGANPQIYGRWGFPGHEGVDIRARTSTEIYACADGEVYRVHTNPKTHAYGLHVRIRHKDGYKTVYGHMRKILVSVGQRVEAGETIGLADATGASVGSHLHLSLKRDGATKRGETTYPKDIIDPTPFLVWPEHKRSKSMKRILWPAEKCLLGAVGRIGGAMQEGDLALVAKARLEAVLIDRRETGESLRRLRGGNPSIFLLASLRANLSSEPVTPEMFVSLVKGDMGRLYRDGVRYFEVHNEPNLQAEGWGRSWIDGRAFGEWFLAVSKALKDLYPEAKLGFPGLSPGGAVSGWRADEAEFMEQSEDAIGRADWLGVHCYWQDAFGMRAIDGGRSYLNLRRRDPSKLLFITGFGNPSLDMDDGEKASQYLSYYQMVRKEPGLGAAFALALSAEDGYGSWVWRSGDGAESVIAEHLGMRSEDLSDWQPLGPGGRDAA